MGSSIGQLRRFAPLPCMAPATNVCSLELSSEAESQWKVAAYLRGVSLELSGAGSLGPTDSRINMELGGSRANGLLARSLA